jgi:thiol-disulfide isomerase/thioredoxin
MNIPDAATLVRKVLQDEAWVDGVASLHLKLKETWLRTAAGIAAATARYKTQFPEAAVDEKTFPDLKPRREGTIELAFDAKRLYTRTTSDSGRLERLCIWDGHRRLSHELYDSGQESYGFSSTLEHFIFFQWISWPRCGPHDFWWQKADGPSDSWGLAEDFRLLGREDFRGRDCYVLETIQPLRGTLYVGVEDGRLYGKILWVRPDSVAVREQFDEISTHLAAEFAGKPANPRAFYSWLGSLAPDVQRKVRREYLARTRELFVRMFTHWFDEYREIAAGCRIPFVQGYECWNADGQKQVVLGERQMTVVSAVKDALLPDAMFEMPMREGVQVYDRCHEPPLHYKHKNNMTEAEWEAIRAEANQRKKDELARQAAANSVIGREAPPFPAAQWLNSPPLTWMDLKGKFVILDFWSESCGPCRNDIPASQKIHEDRHRGGVWIIGVHAYGSEMPAIEKFMKDFKITYPVCIDTRPPDEKPSFGLMYGQCRVRAIPHSILVNPEGKMVAHGSLGHMLNEAHRLLHMGSSSN